MGNKLRIVVRIFCLISIIMMCICTWVGATVIIKDTYTFIKSHYCRGSVPSPPTGLVVR